jgi:hypothetical protein
MDNTRNRAAGFTLITTLLLLFLLSGIAIGMLMMVNTEAKVGTQDVENNQTFHSAEGAIEKMTADLANTFQTTLAPTVSDITGLSALTPAGPYAANTNAGWPGVSLPVYTLTPVTNAAGNIAFNTGVVASGPFAGLNAETMQVNLQATAQGPLGDEVNMARTVEVALIPVFQFGVFSNGDLAFFTNPTLTFNGRIHTNGDLYLGCAGGNTCTFTNKITAYGNIIRANIPNGLAMGAANDAGNVQLPQVAGGCSGGKPACTTLPTAGNLWGSLTGAGGNPPASGYNAGGGGGGGCPASPSWKTISTSTTAPCLGGMVTDGNYGNQINTGATDLTMPFVSGAVAGTTPGLGNPPGPQDYEIVRQPPAGESPTSPLGASRLYNEAAIRVLLADKPEYLPGGAADADNVRLANMVNPHGNGNDFHLGVATAQPNLGALGAGHAYTTYFATGSVEIPNPASLQAAGSYYTDWPFTPATYAGEYDAADGSLPQLFVGANTYGTAKAPLYISTACNTATGVCPAYPYYTPPTLNNNTANDSQWNLIDGYLRVEFLPAAAGCPGPGSNPDGYCAVTREWLGLGFARDLTPPTAPGFPYVGAAAGQNDINPYAILIFQQPAQRNTTGGWPKTPNKAGTAGSCTPKVGGGYTCTAGVPPEVAYDAFANNPYNGDIANAVPSVTAFNWYPINFYDAREGEPNDTVQGNNSCTPLGVMNAVELDVGNLAKWLAGSIGVTGTLVNSTNQNGYVLYFSDRRGMLPNPNGTQTIARNLISGDAGFEDVVNSASASRAPDGALEPPPAGKTISPEDANLNAALDNFGSKNLGLGLGYVPAAPLGAGAGYSAVNGVNSEINAGAAPNPYLTAGRMATCSVAKNSWVSGARHVLKLVDGGMNAAGTSSYLPHQPAPAAFPNWGGFTVGSENPVYIYGNYNTNAADTYWLNPSNPVDQPHAAAGVIADTVTLLSNSWVDWNSLLLQPTQPQGDRTASTTYYRTAIASGDVQPFPLPAWATGNGVFIGTDGGVGNFLRFLEDWNGGGATLNYSGSMVNLFFSTYNTGLFKCCNYAVYLPPTRNYNFDIDFSTMSELPPGTPLFRDIDNLSYRQTLTACTAINPSTGMCAN